MPLIPSPIVAAPTTRTAPWSSRLLTASTSLRIVLAPVIMALILTAPDARSPEAIAAAALFAAAALSDFVDGRLARRWKLTSPLGAFLDTTADKLLVTIVLLALVDAGRVSAWVAAIIISRELVILGLRSAVALDGTVVEASPWGKLKALIQFGAIVAAILRPGDRLWGLYADEWAMMVAAAVTVASAADYIARFSSQLRGRGES